MQGAHPAYIANSRQVHPQSEASESGSNHSDDNSLENQNEKRNVLEDTDDESPNTKNYSKSRLTSRGPTLPTRAARKVKIQTLLQMPEVDQPYLEKSTTVPPRQSFIPYLQAFNDTLVSKTMYFCKHGMQLRIPQLQKFPLNFATITSFNVIWRYHHGLNLSKPRMKSDIMMTILGKIPYHLNQHMHTTSKGTTTCEIFLLSSSFLATQAVTDINELRSVYTSLFKAVHDFRVKKKDESF
jgi:hypothetical protein